MLKTVLVDDEINALEALEWKLNRYIGDVQIIKCNSPIEAIDVIQNEKPDIVFFNEEIPHFPKTKSFELAEKCDLLLIIGTNAEVYPANVIPVMAHSNKATIIEINIVESHFTHTVTDIFLKGRASDIMGKLGELLYLSDEYYM